MKKITVNNESEIDSMNISSSTKTIFHNAIAEGNVIYSPSQAVTYGAWDGLFYILIDFEGGNGDYGIGEGLNGGYTVQQFDSGWENFWRSHLTLNLVANIITPTNNQQFTLGDFINWNTQYTSTFKNWTERGLINTEYLGTGSKILKS